MALPALATTVELGQWLGSAIPTGDLRAQLLLESASGLVRSAAGQTWVDDDGQLGDVHPDARTITLNAAARAWANPTGVTQKSTGPFTATWSPGANTVTLTDHERRTLAVLREGGWGGLTTISTTRGDIETGSLMVDVEGGAQIEVGVPDVLW